MDLHPGEEIVFDGHPSWRSTLGFYLAGAVAVAVVVAIAWLVQGAGLAVLAGGVALAVLVGEPQPEWELAAGLLQHAVAHHPEVFLDKTRFSMDWYYPVLGGVLLGEAGLARIEERWSTFGTGAKSASIDFVGGRPPSAGSGKTSWTTSRPRRMIRGAQPS